VGGSTNTLARFISDNFWRDVSALNAFRHALMPSTKADNAVNSAGCEPTSFVLSKGCRVDCRLSRQNYSNDKKGQRKRIEEDKKTDDRRDSKFHNQTKSWSTQPKMRRKKKKYEIHAFGIAHV
jgi:hypothetical protein